jgi:hypothetical protein
MSKHSLAAEIWSFVRVNKKWWIMPLLIIMLLMGTLLVVAQGSALAPFIYSIF